MATHGLHKDHHDAIRRQVHAEITARFGDQIYFYEQVGAQLTRLEQRMDDLEARMETKEASLFSRFSSQLSSAFAPSHVDGESAPEQYSPMTLCSAAPAVTSTEGQEDDAEELPESMYNYCMYRFASSSNLWRDPILCWWMLLFALQAITLTAFCVVNDLATTLKGVLPDDQREQATSDCMFSRSYILGVPFIQWLMGYVAIVLVASVIRVDDLDTFQAPFPNVRSGALQWLVRFAWFWQNIYIPGNFGLEAATMFARSADAMEVVMNSLAVTFIMDIDNMVYRNFLSSADKQAYQQRAGLPIQDPLVAERECSWAVFAVNLFIMMCVFTHALANIGQGKLEGQAYVSFFWWTIPPFYILSFGARFILLRVFSNPKQKSSVFTRCTSVIPSSLGAAMGAAMLGASIYMLGTTFTANRVLLPPLIYFDASEFLACAQG